MLCAIADAQLQLPYLDIDTTYKIICAGHFDGSRFLALNANKDTPVLIATHSSPDLWAFSRGSILGTYHIRSASVAQYYLCSDVRTKQVTVKQGRNSTGASWFILFNKATTTYQIVPAENGRNKGTFLDGFADRSVPGSVHLIDDALENAHRTGVNWILMPFRYPK